jgi:hypothetical protein
LVRNAAVTRGFSRAINCYNVFLMQAAVAGHSCANCVVDFTSAATFLLSTSA